MPRLLKFIAVLLLALGVLAGLGYWALARTTQNWFEADLSLRSRLAVASARESLTNHWRSDPIRLAQTLEDITRDERIMAAAACFADGRLLAATRAFPARLSCAALLGPGGHEEHVR